MNVKIYDRRFYDLHCDAIVTTITKNILSFHYDHIVSIVLRWCCYCCDDHQEDYQYVAMLLL